MRSLFTLSLLLAASFSASAAIDTGLLALVPSDSRIITCVDLQRARSSDFGQYLLRRINTEDSSFQELAQQTGFDPRRDLQDFVFASTGAPGGKASQRFAILARGSFDTERIGAAAQAKGATTQSFQGVDLFVNPSNHQQTAFAFPETGVAAFGDVETMREIIANRSNPSNLDPALQQLVSKAGNDNDAWFASSMPGSYLIQHLHQQANQPAQAEALQSIMVSSGGIRFGSDIQLSFDATTRSAQDATSLADVVRFLVSLGQMQAQKTEVAQQGQILGSALSSLDVQTNGNAVHLSVSIPEKSLEQLADSGAGVNARRPRPTTR